MALKWFFVLLSITVLFSCSPELPNKVAIEYETLPQQLDFNVHVKPILSDKCYLCHGPDKANQKAGLQLDVAEAAFAPLPESSGKYAIVPGILAKSEVFHRILASDEEVIMPPPESNLTLTEREKAILIKWIEEGAEYKPHWSLIKPEKVIPPKTDQIENKKWIKNPIDQFISERLEQEGVQPSPEANKELLLRRLSLDLTGLPPTLKELKNFLNDNSLDAYEKQVDRLLASPHYGEKMTMDWMDVARYADTHGYSVDRFRDMSPWRDWVIKSFNENLSYDKFATWQLAGDLLPNPTKEQVLATGFNRLHPQNMEGGIVQEEFRVEYVLDRVNTAGQAFMAMTLACSRCHDHKFDPISQKDYFQLSSFFNNINEAGQISWDDAMPVPTMLWTDEKKEVLLKMLENDIKEKESGKEELAEKEKRAFETWLSNKRYHSISNEPYPIGILAHFDFDNKHLVNKLNLKEKGKMQRVASEKEVPVFTKGKTKEGLQLDGDAWFDCANIGVFKRSKPFSVGIQVNIPKEITDGVIFHKGSGTALYNLRGFHLALKDNKLELLMAHTAPDNAIIEYTVDIPRDQWVQLTLTYDGSSKAKGLKVFVNGKERQTEVLVDNLYKEIIFDKKSIGGQPGIQVGARWRGQGIGGASVDDIIIFDRELTPIEISMISDRMVVEELISKSSTELSNQEIENLQAYYLSNYSKAYQSSLLQIEKSRTAYTDSMENVQEVMVMKENSKPRKTYLLERGLYDAHGEEVFPGTPESIMSMPEDFPKNRLGLAKWLTHPDHPLMARVTVNRYWQNFFGRGLVRTSNDFGNQGELPSHPELLDWLAVTFRESGWNVKALNKLIVMSATYRQSSVVSNELKEKDPDNILLARGPQGRLSSEMLRDNALLASELLNKTIGGKSVKPYQPEGLWAMTGEKYIQDTGKKLYRRSLYTLWKRTAPHPTLATFDQPERSECTVNRQKTNTPLQSLVLLNDPTFIEAARVIGESITQKGNSKDAITEAYRKLTARSPSNEELNLLLIAQTDEYQKFKADPLRKKGWLSTGEYEVESSLDQDMVAANAVLASIIINSDAFITRR
ncbi:MAG: DUF1553 domain-containing protein [Bacteroidota bacterium]